MPLSDLIGVLNQYRDASASNPPRSVEADYSQVAPHVQQSDLATGLANAFRSDQTPPFGQMLGSLFSNSNGQQRAGILNQLLGAMGPTLLTSGALGSLTGLFGGGRAVTPEQAEQIPTEAVTQLAEHAEKQNPSIVEQASQFYAQHPTLVQALGAGSLALIMSHLSRK
jgi:hypothetical protein